MSYQIAEINAETNELVIREATPKEVQDRIKIDEELTQEATLKAEKEVKRKAAEAKLAVLGLTADDLKALGL
jgi:hypothetical protein